jgi:diguanylate cyclase (GGDEF)-like protein
MTYKTFVAPVNPAARNRGVLTMTAGPDVGRVVSLPPGEQRTFGRSEECTEVFNDGGLSRSHARVIWLAGTHMVEDLGSTNGTFVNDERVTEPKPLRDGDRIQLGSNIAFRYSLVTEEEETNLRRVYEASTRDGLTGVFTRKHLEERLDAEIAFAVRHHAPLSVIMLDVDHFKRINDTYGHPGGDAVLRNLGALLVQGLRTEDIAGRYGGEEFMVVLRNITISDGVLAAERLRRVIESTSVAFDGRIITHTSSMGVASIACVGATADRGQLVRVADQRLYLAKERGRNCVVGEG